MARLFLILLLQLTTISQVFAWGWEEFKGESATPVTTDAKYFLYGGSALTLAVVLLDDPIVDPFQQKTARNKTLGDSSKWGDWMGQLIPNAIYVGWMGIEGYRGNPEGYRRAIGMFKATAYATSVSTILKYTVREPRPIDWHWKTSFPSGHTTSAFAFSGYVMAEHEYSIGIPALLLSTFIGYSRINDNKHWLQDVTAGATIGWVYGWGISRLQRKQLKEKKEEMTMIVPMLDSQTAGVALYREF